MTKVVTIEVKTYAHKSQNVKGLNFLKEFFIMLSFGSHLVLYGTTIKVPLFTLE